MTTLLDRILLFAISILFINKNQVDYTMVCLILVVIIAEAVIFYFQRKQVTAVITLVFMICSLIWPELVAFYPLFAYECMQYELYSVSGIVVIAALVTNVVKGENELFSRSTYAMAVLLALALALGWKARKEELLSKKVHNLQDEESYLVLKSKQSHEELRLQQDSEIHAATLAERNRIAREIHDHVGHMLSRSILQLGAILAINKDENLQVPLRGLKDTLDTAMNNIRESVHDLKDDALDLEYMAKDIIKQYENLYIELDYDMGKYLSKELKYCLVAILKEALTNTVKHSDSTKVMIVMREHPGLYQVLIEDNGSQSAAVVKALKDASGKTGIGLENIRERVNAFGGSVRFTGENGFKIFITIPKK